MKKILFLLACLWLVLPFPSRAEKAASSVSAANGESEELKIIPLRPTGDPLVNTSSGWKNTGFVCLCFIGILIRNFRAARLKEI